MLDEPHVQLQQATAAGASVVIQVGRDLYVSDAGLSALWTPGAAVPGECPFPGLDAFGPAQADWFFGRERLTGELLELLDEAVRTGSGDPLLVVGPSGAGKSSLLGAGLLAGLEGGRLPAAGSRSWPRLMITPGAHPMRTLRRALAVCTQVQGGVASRVVVVVDQLEEIFTACPDEVERSEFLAALADLASGSSGAGPAVVLVLGLRADFYAQATGYPLLRAAMRSRQVVVGAMTSAEIRQAMIRPARSAGLRLDHGLVERLLGDLGVEDANAAGAGVYEAGRLPLLSHALRATWQRRDGDRLTIAGYEAAGGISGAIAKTADDIYLRLDEAGARAARQLFLALVRVGEADDADGAGTADTRRRVSAESLDAAAPDPDVTRAVRDAFTSARLLTSGGQAVQITHEALLRRWPRLRDWIGEDRAGNLIRQGVEEAAAAWDREGRDASALFGGARLAAAQAWTATSSRTAELSRAARDFLTASGRLRRRGIRRRNQTIAALTVLVLLVAGVAGFALAQRAVALSRYHQAESSVLAVQSTAEMARGHPDTAAEFAVQAQRLEPTSPQARSAVLSTQAQPIAGRLWPGGGNPNTGTMGQVLGVTYSPGGGVIATCTSEGYVQLWSASDYRQLAVLKLGGRVIVHDVAFSPDGRMLAAALSGGVHLWNVTNPRHPVADGLIRTDTDSQKFTATALTFSPDGHTLAAADSDGAVDLWDLTSHRLGGTISTSATDLVIRLAFAGQGHLLAMATQTGAVELWDPARNSTKILLPAGDILGAVAVAPDGQTIAFGAGSIGHASIKLWSLAAHRVTATLTGLGSQSYASSLAFSPGGDVLAAGGLDDSVKLWDIQAGLNPFATLNGHRMRVADVAFSPNGATLASASTDGTVALWKTPGATFGGRHVATLTVAFSPDGHLLALGADYPGATAVALYALPSRRRVALLSTGRSLVTALAFSGNGQMLAAAVTGPTVTVRLWNLHTGRPAGQIETGQKAIFGLALNPDGRLLATAGDLDPMVRLWDTTSGSQVAVLNTDVNPSDIQLPGNDAVTFSPDGRLLAVAGIDGLTLLYTVTGGALVGICDSLGTQDTSVAFSPDGHTVAIGQSVGSVSLFAVHQTPSNGVSGPFPPPESDLAYSTQAITSVAYGPGGTLVTAGYDGSVRLFNAAKKTLIESISTGGQISAMAYSSSLGVVATAIGAVASIWQTDPKQLAAGICRTLKAPVNRIEWKDDLPGIPYTPVCR